MRGVLITSGAPRPADGAAERSLPGSPGAPPRVPDRDHAAGLRATDDVLTPIDLFLHQQQTMTAVERFSFRHDLDAAAPGALPAQALHYRDLIPLARPGAGQQFGFEVDLDSCSGCKACVTACHSLNGLDEGESFRSAGALFGVDAWGQPWQQTVTTTCHHCVDPACLNGCPVDAYEKDPVTGIVRHLDDQCIGCQYCTLMCPYDVPRYNADLGIVRKCDLCSDRLAEGEAPACVQACPTSAISVTIVDVEALTAELEDALAAEPGPDAPTGEPRLVPAAPSSAITRPTTRYRSATAPPATALPADHFSLDRAHAHTPLAVMLVLTQLAVGAFVTALVCEGQVPATIAARLRPFEVGVALAAAATALGASVLHLGRPWQAWRAVIGVRHSWLSREIVAFGAFAVLTAAFAVAVVRAPDAATTHALGVAAAVAGLAGLLCSVQIYVVTGRRWWRFARTAPTFGATAVITGALATVFAVLVGLQIVGSGASPAVDAVLRGVVRPLALTVVIVGVLELVGEASIFRHARHADRLGDPRLLGELTRTAILLRDDLSAVTAWRYSCGFVGAVVLPLVIVASAAAPGSSLMPLTVVAFFALAASTAGELCERFTFFAAITSPRMPGVSP